MAHPTREVSFDPLVAIGLIKTTSHHTSHRGVLVNRLKARLGTQSLSPRPWRSHFGGCTTRARPCEREPGSMECLIAVAVDSGLKLESGGVRPEQSCALAKTKEGCCSGLRCRELYATVLLTHSFRALP